MEVLTNHIVPLDLSPVGLIVGMENKSSSTFVLSLGQTTSKMICESFFQMVFLIFLGGISGPLTFVDFPLLYQAKFCHYI